MQKIVKHLRIWALLLVLSGFVAGRTVSAQEAGHGTSPAVAESAPHAVDPHAADSHGADAHGADSHGADAHGADAHGAATHGEGGHGGGHGEEKGTFDPHAGTFVNPIGRAIFGTEKPEMSAHGNEPNLHVNNVASIRYDYIVIALLIMLGIGIVFSMAGKKAKVRPEGRPGSAANLIEAAVEGFREYLIGIMGRDLAIKYAPLLASFFFTILFMNWMGLVPGMLAPTSNPNIPISIAIVAFFCVHIIAIKEAGVKSWLMHFVGEPLWLAPLNLPLHLVGEIIKPLSLSLRLLCNVFGEEMVILTLTGLAVSVLPIWLPIPFQLPMLFLGSFFGFLQALVFTTLLAIYVSIFATHHDDHDENNIHGHVEHVQTFGHNNLVAHPTESPVA